MANGKRGLVVSSPVRVEGTSFHLINSNIDLGELRFALLFWDELAFPSNNAIHIGAGANEQFLIDVGIMSRPNVQFIGSGDMAQIFAIAHLKAFQDLDAQEPGKWALAQGERSFFFATGAAADGRGVLVELHRAIPVPDKDVPLDDILQFREKRRPELLRLRTAVDDIYLSVQSASDQEHELRRRLSEIEQSCLDLIKVSKEWPNPFRLSDLKLSVQISPADIIKFAAGGGAAAWWATSGKWELSALGALVGGAASLVTVNRDFGLADEKARQHPFRYASLYHTEVF